MKEPARTGTPAGSVVKGYHHVALRAHDFDASMKFYREGLGLTEVLAWGEGAGRAVMLDVGGGSRLEVFAGGSGTPPVEGAFLHVAFATADCDAALARARGAGGRVTKEPTTVTIPGQPHPAVVRLAFCTGPDGEVIEFFQSRDV